MSGGKDARTNIRQPTVPHPASTSQQAYAEACRRVDIDSTAQSCSSQHRSVSPYVCHRSGDCAASTREVANGARTVRSHCPVFRAAPNSPGSREERRRYRASRERPRRGPESGQRRLRRHHDLLRPRLPAGKYGLLRGNNHCADSRWSRWYVLELGCLHLQSMLDDLGNADCSLQHGLRLLWAMQARCLNCHQSETLQVGARDEFSTFRPNDAKPGGLENAPKSSPRRHRHGIVCGAAGKTVCAGGR